ncbi:DgyrCDS14836 [Dimorphilus gyrociliatus]|uniref:DgyrCDS14836 n=1 Tax=Dimorphilus gyrociliatus TaxID=2664684 RepID=A0A7I8WF39_9ANNE|nr:DgyrCDS14836 [Dimorphilus gyrociliatus]
MNILFFDGQGLRNKRPESLEECRENYFQCKTDNICINIIYKCDGFMDCKSGEDEFECSEGKFSCFTTTEEINYKLVCNNIVDCSDGSDESNCIRRVPDTKYRSQCKNGQFIPFENVCDNEFNCFDGSDEICFDESAIEDIYKITCNSKTQFLCNYQSTEKQCLQKGLQCNLKKDCQGYEDELDCSTLHCRKENPHYCNIQYSSTGFLSNGTGFPILLKKLCLDRSCQKEQYKCFYEGYCIGIELVCDGINHCLYGDDELDCGKRKKLM